LSLYTAHNYIEYQKHQQDVFIKNQLMFETKQIDGLGITLIINFILINSILINYAPSNLVNIKFFGMKSDRKLSKGGGFFFSFERYIILEGLV